VTTPPPLRIAFATVIRDAFKGDATSLTARALTALERRGATLGYEVDAAPEAVRDVAAARRVGAWAAAGGFDYLLCIHATFATADLLAPLLRSTDAVGVWAVPEAEGLPLARPGVRTDMRPLPLNSLCGLNMTLSTLDHPAVAAAGAVKWYWGAPGSPAFERRWEATVRALHGLRALRHARVLQIGGTAPAFYRLEERPSALGAVVDSVPLTTLYERMAACPADGVEARAAAWSASEAPVGATPEHVRVAARTELALAALAAEGGYQALALRCWPEFADACGGMACAAVGALADRGVPTACEGDVMGALSMLALQAVARAPSALVDLSDLDPERDRLLLWHCGNAPIAFAGAAGARLTTHFNRDGTGVVRDMHLRPGPASGFRLLEGGAASVIVTGTIDEPSEPDVDGVRGWWRHLRWDGTPRTAFEVVSQVLDARLPHHLALAPGEVGEALHELTIRLGGRVVGPARVRDALVIAP
jgi:L-fucose isomerase-like protein